MEIKEMRLLLSMAEEKNLTRAAEKHGYTQSAASHILKNMEKEVGFPLFSRTQKGLILTNNGQTLLPYLRRMLTDHELLEQEISSLRGIRKGHITIGTYLSISMHWLPPTLRRFYNDYPDMTVDIREGGFQDIDTWLENGAIDFGLTGLDPSNHMEWLSLKKDPFFAICPADSPYVKQGYFDLHDLEKEPCILLEQATEHDLYRVLGPLGITPNSCLSSYNEHTMLALTEQHLGICVLPSLVVEGNLKSLKALPVIPPLERELGIRIPSLKNASPAARLFIQYLQDTVNDLFS